MKPYCYNHPTQPSALECELCHQSICAHCINKMELRDQLKASRYSIKLVCPSCRPKIQSQNEDMQGYRCGCIVITIFVLVILAFL